MARARSTTSGNSVTMIARITEAWAAAPIALEEAGADQRALGGRDAAQQRRDREDDEAGEEHALSPDEVAEAPGEEQQAAEGDEERVDDPGEVALAEVEVLLDRGQRDVHDRDVEDDHQLRQADDASVAQRRLSAAEVGTEAVEVTVIRLPTCRNARLGLKWRPPPKQPEATSGTIRRVPPVVKEIMSTTETRAPDTHRAAQAGRRAAQLREGARCRAAGVCRGRRIDRAGGDRAPRRRRDRDALPALPQPAGAARGSLRR